MVKAHFHFVTLFPELIIPWLSSSILGRALKAGVFHFDVLNLRDFATNAHRTVDDVAYGGGGGMVLKIEPLVLAVEHLKRTFPNEESQTICFSPGGKRLTQNFVQSLLPKTAPKHYLLICGHYEGIDQRFVNGWVDTEISLGDFVLTGGELPALAFADALIRHLDGTLPREGASTEESFLMKEAEGVLIEYPHYTRPAEFRGHKVPEILLSGDHGKVAQWRRNEAIKKTQTQRPDLLSPCTTL